MSTLASLHSGGQEVLINPDHFSMAVAAPGGTLITLSNGETVLVSEDLATVHGYINAAILVRRPR